MEEKKNISAEGEPVTPEAPVAESPVADAPTPDLNTGPAAPQEQEGITPADPGDVVVSFDKIEELMAERRAAARAVVEQSEPTAPEAGAPAEGQTVAVPPEQAEEKAAGDKALTIRGMALRCSPVFPTSGQSVPRWGKPMIRIELWDKVSRSTTRERRDRYGHHILKSSPYQQGGKHSAVPQRPF